MGGGLTKVDDKFPLGVKISFFDEFIARVGGENVLKNLSTASVCEKILKPLMISLTATSSTSTSALSLSYCQQLILLDDKNPLVGQSEVLIIHSWYTPFLDVVNILKYHFINEPDVYVWFDLFSVALHKEIDDFDQFLITFNNNIKNFNRSVLIVPIWSETSSVFSRLWCNYEMYCSYQNKVRFEIAMSPEQQEKFYISTLYDTINTIDNIKSTIDCENCNCYYPYKDRLFSYLNKIGYDNVNNGIFNVIRDSILNSLNKAYDDDNINDKDKTTIKYSIAHVYRTKGDYDQAESCYLAVLESRKSILGCDHVDTLHTQFSLASFYDDNDFFEKAETLYIETLERSKAVLTEYHPISIGIQNNLAALYMHSPSNIGLVKIKIDQLYINDVEDCGSMFDKQDPAIIITINGDQILKTKRVQEGGTSAVFPEVFETMANYSDAIEIQVVNMDGLGFTKAKIGYSKIRIYQAVPNIDDGPQAYTLRLKNSQSQYQGTCGFRILCEPFNVSSVNLVLDELSVSDIEDAGSVFDKQDPALKISIGENKYSTERICEGGTSASFPEVFEIENVRFSEDIYVQVVNMDALGFSKKTIGVGKLKVYQAISNLDEHVSFTIELTNSKEQAQGFVNIRGIATMTDDVVVDKKGLLYEKAEQLWIESLALQLEIQGNLHVDTLKTFENLACLYHKMKMYDKCQYMYEQVLAAQKVMLGVDDLRTLATMENLAAAMMFQQQPMKAEPLFSFVYDTRKKKLGDNNPLVLKSMEALGVLYYKSKFPFAAVPLLEKCLAIRKVVLGESDSLTINTMGTLAEVYKDIGENFKAETLYLQILQKSKEVKGHDHFSTLNLHHIVATFYAYKKGDLKKAEELVSFALDKQKEMFGDDHHSTKHSTKALEIVRKKIEIKAACYN